MTAQAELAERSTAPPRAGDRIRPEIQALRAVAVTLVLLYHLWPGRLGGGYVGVDVFFVISGFLITGHLMREVDWTGPGGFASSSSGPGELDVSSRHPCWSFSSRPWPRCSSCRTPSGGST